MQLLAFSAQAGHEDRARLVPGADEDVVRPGRAVEEVPRLQAPLLVLDDEDALAREDEEVFLDVLRVVLPVRLARGKDVDADPVVLESVGWLEVGPVAALFAFHPARVRQVDDEPARRRGGRALLGLFERSPRRSRRETMRRGTGGFEKLEHRHGVGWIDGRRRPLQQARGDSLVDAP